MLHRLVTLTVMTGAITVASLTTATAAPAICPNGWFSSSALLAAHNARFNAANDSTCLRIQACVNFDAAATLYADTVLIEGSLRFTDGANRTLNARRIYVIGPDSDIADPAELIIGTAAAPFQSTAKLALADRGVANCTQQVVINPTGGVSVSAVPSPDPYHPDPGDPDAVAKLPTRTLYAQGRVNLELHGKTREATWKPLLATIGPTNATPAPLLLPFLGTPSWVAGDEVVVASTDFDLTQAERQTLTAAPMLVAPWTWQFAVSTIFDQVHWAGRVGDNVAPLVYENAEIGLLSHNVKIFTPTSDLGAVTETACPSCEDPNAPECVDPVRCSTCGERAIDLVFDGAEVRLERDDDARAPTFHIEQVEVYNAGKFGQLGHYPLHLHELGPVPGSYIRRSSIHDSANRGIALHAVQQVNISQVVTADVVGHAFYLEPDAVDPDEPVVYATRHNTLAFNLATGTYGCGPLEKPVKPDDLAAGAQAAGFYFDDPRNVLWGNSAAGYDHTGFYFGLTEAMVDVEDPTVPLDCYHLCGDAQLDYATTSSIPLDTNPALYTAHSHQVADYAVRLPPNADGSGVCVGISETTCHGTFRWNIAHSGQWGFWGEEHKDTLTRLTDFLVYKNHDRGVGTKNKGFTEMVRLRAADNGSGVWPASHAYHLGRRPETYLVDSHLVGLSDNHGDPHSGGVSPAELGLWRSLPREGAVPILGVEVYEGHLHVARTHFDGFTSLVTVDPPEVAAFGRHQSFPFYSNDPHNSLELVTVAAGDNPLWFDPPGEDVPAALDDAASGFQTVLLTDLDGSLGQGVGVTFAPRHDFILPGAQCVPAGVCDPAVDASLVTAATEPSPTDWNAYIVDPAVAYGQVIVNWCDDAQGCHHRDAPSLSDTPWIQLNRDIETVEGLEVRDLTDCPALGACTHVMKAAHSNEGVHSQLGGNLVLDRNYAVTLWADESSQAPLVDVSALTALEVMLRGAPAGRTTCVTVPVASYPCEVLFSRGELDGEYQLLTATAVAVAPVAAGEWRYSGATSPGVVELCLDADVDRKLAAMTVIVEPESIANLGDGVNDCLPAP